MIIIGLYGKLVAGGIGREIMKQDDKIIELQTGTYQVHKLENGLWDMTFGFALVLIGFGLYINNPLFLWLCIFGFTKITQELRKKYIYPRVGIAVFAGKVKQNPIKKTLLVALVLSIGLAIYLFFNNLQGYVRFTHPLFNTIGVLISGLVILGGISHKHSFYFMSVVLMIPVIGLQFSKGLWIGMSLMMLIIVFLLGLIMWRVSKGKTEDDDNAVQRISYVMHCYLMEVGLLCFAYFILATYFSDFSESVIMWGFAHETLVIGNVAALAVIGVGISFKVVRYYLYAVLFSLSVFAARVFTLNIIPRRMMFGIIGFLIMIIGLILFLRFIQRYPVLEKVSDVS